MASLPALGSPRCWSLSLQEARFWGLESLRRNHLVIEDSRTTYVSKHSKDGTLAQEGNVYLNR